jgi:hypothetical protein
VTVRTKSIHVTDLLLGLAFIETDNVLDILFASQIHRAAPVNRRWHNVENALRSSGGHASSLQRSDLFGFHGRDLPAPRGRPWGTPHTAYEACLVLVRYM